MPRIHQEQKSLQENIARRNLLEMKIDNSESNIAALEEKKKTWQSRTDIMGQFLVKGDLQKLEKELLAEHKELAQARAELAELNRDTETALNETPAEYGRDVSAKAEREKTDVVVRGEKVVAGNRDMTPEERAAILAVGSEAAKVYTLTQQQLDEVIAKAVARALEAEVAKKAAAPEAAAGAGTGTEAAATPAKKRASKKKPGSSGAEGAGGGGPPESPVASAAEEPEDEGRDTDVATLGFIGKLLSKEVKSIDALEKLAKKSKDRIHNDARRELPRMMSELSEDQRKNIIAKLEELGLIDRLPVAGATPARAPARPAGAPRTAAESAPAPAPATTRTAPEAAPTVRPETFDVARILTALATELGPTWKEDIIAVKNAGVDITVDDYDAFDGLSEAQLAQVIAAIESPAPTSATTTRVETAPAAGGAGATGTTSRTAETGTPPTATTVTTGAPATSRARVEPGTAVAASATGAPAPRVEPTPAPVVAPVVAQELTRRDSKVESYESEMQALDTAIQTFADSLTWDQFGEPGRNLFPKIAEIVRAFAPKLGFSDNQDIVALANNYYEKLLEKVEETLKIGVAKANEKKVTEIFGINLKEEGKQLVRSFAGGGLYGGAMRIASGLTRVTEKVLTTAFLPARLVAMGVGAVHGFIAGGLSATATEVGVQGGKDLVSLAKNLRSKGLKRSTGGHTQEEKIKSLYRDFTAGMQRAQEANDTTKLEDLGTIQQNLSKGVGANLRGLVSYDMRRRLQISDIRAMKAGVTFATGGSADIDQLLQYAENGRFKDNKKERDEREKLLTKVSSNGTLEALIRSAIKKENDRLLAEEGEAGLTPEQKKEVTKRAILSIERTMNALLGDLVVQEKTSGLTERYGLEYASKIFGNEPPETWTQRFLRGGVNGAIAGAIMGSGSEAAAIYMGLTRFGSGIRSEMLKRRGDDRPVRTAGEILHDLATFTAGATIDVGSARDKIIDARARIKLPDMKEADRARIEDAIDALERAMMKRGVLEAVVDENNKVLKIKYQNVEASEKAATLAKDEKARKAWLFSKEAILVKYAKMWTEKGSRGEALKILLKSGARGTVSAMVAALGASAVDYAAGDVSLSEASWSAVDRAALGFTHHGVDARVDEIESRLKIDIDDGLNAEEKDQVAVLSGRDQAAIQTHLNDLVHDGKLVSIGGEYQTPEVAVVAMKQVFLADDEIQRDELAMIRAMPDSVRNPVLAHIESLVAAGTLVAVADARGNIVAYEAPHAVTAEPPAPEPEKPAEMSLVNSTNPHGRRTDDKGLDPTTWHTIEGFADKGQDYMTINLDVKDAVGRVTIRVEGGTDVARMVQEWIDTSQLKTTGEILLTGEEKSGDRLFIAGAKTDTAVLIFRSMTTGHPEDGIEMMCETRHAGGGEYEVEGVGIVNGAFDGAIRGAVPMDGASDSAQANTNRYHSDVRIDTNHDGTPDPAIATEFKANKYGEERVSAYEYTDLDDKETHTVDVAVADANAKPVEQKYVSQEMGSDAPSAILHGAYKNGEWKPVVDQDIASLTHAADVRHDDIEPLPDPAHSTTAEYLAAVEVMTTTLNRDPYAYNSATHEFTYWNGKGFDRTAFSVPEGASIVEDKPGHFQVKLGDNLVKQGILSFDKDTSTWKMEDEGTSTNLDAFDDDVDTAVLDHGVKNTWVANEHKDKNIAILKHVGAFDTATQKFTFAGFVDSDDANTFVARFRDVIDGTNPEEVRLAYAHRTEDPRTIERIIEDAPMLNAARIGITTLEQAFQFEEERFPNGTKFGALTEKGVDGVKVDRHDNLPDLFIDANGIHAINAQSGEHGPAVLVDDLLNQTKLDVGVNKAVTLLATQEAAKLAVGKFAVGEHPNLSDADVKVIRESTWEHLVAEEWAPNDVRAGAREEVRTNIMEKLVALHVVTKQGEQYVPDQTYLAERHHTAAEFKAMKVDAILQEAVTNNAQVAEYVVKVSAGVKAVEEIVDAGKQGGWAPDLNRGVVPHVLAMDASTVEGWTDAQYAKEIARLAGWSWMGTQQDNLENVHKEIVKIIHELDKKQADMPAGEKTPAQKMQEYGITLSVRPNVGEVLQAYQQLQMIERGEARLLPASGYVPPGGPMTGTPPNPGHYGTYSPGGPISGTSPGP